MIHPYTVPSNISVMPNPLCKQDIKDFTKSRLISWLNQHGIAPFRADQIFRWIYNAQTDDFSAMTNINKDIRALLAEYFTIGRLKIKAVESSNDGAQKYLFELSDGNLIESVFIPGRTHDTLCISSQVGCAQGCKFCLTAKTGFIRNLSVGEILAQVRDIRKQIEPDRQITNIVLMGMGEPLANYENVINALEILTNSEAGLGFSPRKITLSTAGLVPKIAQLGLDSQVNIAISLNAVDNDTRNRLMPINKKYPIEQLMAVCREYPLLPRRKITFEYILIKDVNESPAHAKKLAALLRPIRAKINLIPFNPHEGCEMTRPDWDTVLKFQKILNDLNYTANIRQSKGSDISAACGQLRARAVPTAKTP
ncbi:MAG: 23S rRNA (adenine(2503)-C(2))-methyltransferase RlmN [Desulfobacterales bacterium]|jgi:23S rRNA (adenine2503-C2)-methyltransferase|nr:23S rRNA (adenine(2503)-C(2))-methyltransferase RlmN [Desulfobacterales bacterium]